MFEERFVCYIDILGFSELVKQSVDDKEIQRRVHAVTTVYSLWNDGNFPSKVVAKGGDLEKAETLKRKLRMTGFSDNLIISAEHSEKALRGMLEKIFQLTSVAVAYGMFVRGGIDFGLILHDDWRVYGPAVITCVDMEKKAKAPRIVLSKIFLENPIAKKMSGFFIQDTDGWQFLDWFGYLKNPGNKEGRECFVQCVEGIQAKMPSAEIQHSFKLIRSKIEEEKSRIPADKYAWLKSYFDRSAPR